MSDIREKIQRNNSLKQQCIGFIDLTFSEWQQQGLSGRVNVEMVWSNGQIKFVRNTRTEQYGENGSEPKDSNDVQSEP